jgi:hypothetical protein
MVMTGVGWGRSCIRKTLQFVNEIEFPALLRLSKQSFSDLSHYFAQGHV